MLKSSRKAARPNGQGPAPKSKVQWDHFFTLVVENAGNVTRACEGANITRSAVWDRQRTDPEFAEQLAEARRAGVEVLEDEATRRAFEGVEEPVGFFQGISNEVKTNYSDGLIQFLLKANNPDKFKDRSVVEHQDAGRPLEQLTDEELEVKLAKKARGVAK